jgi:hypothetical protein
VRATRDQTVPASGRAYSKNSASDLAELIQTPYQLRFDEQIDGRWQLMDFEDRQAFSDLAIKRMPPYRFMIPARP